MSKAKSPRKVGEKEALSVGTQIRGSAQKLGLVAALIRNKKAGDAMNILAFSTKGAKTRTNKTTDKFIIRSRHARKAR